MCDRKPENQVRGCSRLLVQSVPSADPRGTPQTRLKGPGLHLCSFTHTAGVRWSPGMRPTFILYTQQASKAVGQKRYCAQNVNLTKKALSSSRQHHLLTLYTTIQVNNRLPKTISQLADNSTSLFFFFIRIKPEGSFRIHKSPEMEYRSRCSYKTVGRTVRVSYPGRGESFFLFSTTSYSIGTGFLHWW